MRSLAPVKTHPLDPEELQAYFQNSWELYEWLFSSIREDDKLYINPDPLRHPLIFYLGHTAVFYINKMVLAGILLESDRINPRLELLFAKGVDPAKAEELGGKIWPTVTETREYRRKAYDLLTNYISQIEPGQMVDSSHPLWSILMGLEHDRIHFETSSMLIRQYPVEWLQRPEGWDYAPVDVPVQENEWLDVPPGEVQLGKPLDFPTFGWDNEYGSLDLNVKGFQATRNLISNAEFKAFVDAGGYENKEYWSDEGWHWKEKFNINHPKFWVPGEDGFQYRAMFDNISMPDSWPAEVNAHEAVAYCNWVGNGARLMTEGEFQAIAQTAMSQPFDLPFSDAFNLNLKFGSPSPVGMLQAAGSTLGFNDVWGNVWTWLSNDFYPLQGFETHPYYDDFSEPYMDPSIL